MKRTVDMKEVASVLDGLAEVEYRVALARNEDLWETKRATDDRIYFLYLIGLIDNDERTKMLDRSEGLYKEKKKIQDIDESFDVGF
jgi:hypothetical protein